MSGPYLYPEPDEIPMFPRVIILVDAGEAEILEAPEGLAVEVIPWGKITANPELPEEFIRELEQALEAGELDKALEISRGLTAEPPDDGEDPAAL